MLRLEIGKLGALRETRRCGEKQSLELLLGGDRGASCRVWAEIQQDRTRFGEEAGYLLTLVNISARTEEVGTDLAFFPLDAGHVGATILDISEAKKNEAQLSKTCHDLEIVVRERTHELRQAQLELANEADARKTLQNELVDKSGELKSLVEELREVNAALQALLRERDRERARLEEKVVSNINELVRPQLARLAEGQLSSRQRSLLESIGNSLDEIASPFSRRFNLLASRLTPIETQVAEYIRQGRSTKEIAGMMGVAVCTIDYHRLSIRRRLGLTSKSINLQYYLRSLL